MKDQSYPSSWKKPELTDEQRANWVLWIKRLKNTRLPQGEGQLRSPDGKYCCLGIACNVLNAKAGLKWLSRSNDWCVKGAGQVDSAEIPEVIWPLLGITDGPCPVPPGLYTGTDTHHCIVAYNLNDSVHLAFKQIAKVPEWAYLDGPRPTFYSES